MGIGNSSRILECILEMVVELELKSKTNVLFQDSMCYIVYRPKMIMNSTYRLERKKLISLEIGDIKIFTFIYFCFQINYLKQIKEHKSM